MSSACGATSAEAGEPGHRLRVDSLVGEQFPLPMGAAERVPADVAVEWVSEVPEDFDARGSATFRRYRYCIEQAPRRPVLSRRYVWWLRESLSCAAMTAAAVHWLGEQDFSAFRAAQCQSTTPMRHLSKVQVRRDGRARFRVAPQWLLARRRYGTR